MRRLKSSGSCFLVRPTGPFLRPGLRTPVRRAQRRSRLAEGHRRRRLGLDRREHGAKLAWAGIVLSGSDREPRRGRSTLCIRAPGASTYIRQLHDGLPQSCMHSRRSRRRVHTFCRRDKRQSKPRRPVTPLPAGAGSSEVPVAGYAAADPCSAVLLMTVPAGTRPVST
jgi:hypothetical protein